MLNPRLAVKGVGVVESVAFTVKFDVPVAFGVPEITPVEAFSIAHEGSPPELILHM
jgi:hypothetical protein